MENGKFQVEVLERLKKVENEIHFIRGLIEGKKERRVSRNEKITLGLSILAVIVSIGVFITRVM